MRNITLALDEDLLRKARYKAVDNGLSLSGYVAKILEEVVSGRAEAVGARQRLLARMEQGYDLGFSGKLPYTREELHLRGFDTGEQPREWQVSRGPDGG